MNFTICKDNEVFSYLIVDNFYDEKEQLLIWEELDYLQSYLKEDNPTETHGSAIESDGSRSAKLVRIYLDDFYGKDRHKSNIFSVYQKIISPTVLEAYRLTTPTWRTFEMTNTDQTVINYYDNGDSYKPHIDVYQHTVLIWFYREPKKFIGGDLFFPQSNEEVECKHNRLIIFPSYYLHQVKEVNLEEKYIGKNLGRYCLTHFYNIRDY